MYIDTYVNAGGKLYVFGPYVGSRQVSDEELIPGATIVGGVAFVAGSLNATQSLIY